MQNRKTARKRILICGLYAPGSGLTNVLSNLVHELKPAYAVHSLGFQPRTAISDEDIFFAECPLHISRSRSPYFIADPRWIDQHFEDVGPDVVLVIGPFFLITNFLNQLQKYRGRCQLMAYLPLEGKIVSPDIIKTLGLIDHCILYTNYSLANVQELCNEAVAAGTEFKIPAFHVIGHGIDDSLFYPIYKAENSANSANNRSWIRDLFLPERGELHNAFIVLNTNKFYYRKRLDLSIKGFALFAKNHSDAYLYLHTGKISTSEKARLQALIAASGCEQQILLNTISQDNQNLTINELNLLYNMCNVGLSTSMGEGWGLTSFEHAATGAPQIVPNHTGFTENWSECAALLPIVGTEYIFYEGADMFVVSPEAVAQELELLYTSTAQYAKMAKAAYLKTTDPTLSWASVGRKFSQIIAAQ